MELFLRHRDIIYFYHWITATITFIASKKWVEKKKKMMICSSFFGFSWKRWRNQGRIWVGYERRGGESYRIQGDEIETPSGAGIRTFVKRWNLLKWKSYLCKKLSSEFKKIMIFEQWCWKDIHIWKEERKYTWIFFVIKKIYKWSVLLRKN